MLPIEEVELYGSFVHVFSRDKNIEKKVKNYLRQEQIKIKQVTMIEPSLEDVFIASVRSNELRNVEKTKK